MYATSVISDQTRVVDFCNAARVLARCCALPCAPIDELSAMCTEASGSRSDALAESLRGLASALEACEQEAFDKAYAQLFLGPFEILVPPYASWFLEVDQQMMGPVAQAAAEAYAHAGLGPGEGPQELPDHVSVELEFLYVLGYRAVDGGQTEAYDMLTDFWLNQVSSWLPRFADAVTQHAPHPVFAALARALDSLCHTALQPA